MRSSCGGGSQEATTGNSLRGLSGSPGETNKPIAQVARNLPVNEGTLGNWVARAREARDGSSSLSTTQP